MTPPLVNISSELAAEADRFEALTPPAQLSEWHLLNIEGFRTIQAFVDLQPKDDVIDFVRFFLMASISADSEEKLGEAAVRLPEDVLERMIEAGCIDPEDCARRLRRCARRPCRFRGATPPR